METIGLTLVSKDFGGFYAHSESLGDGALFIHQQAGDRFQGHAGLDHYVIGAIPGEVTIDNDSPQQQQDILQLDWEVSIPSLELSKTGQDLLITERERANLSPQIRITDFFLSASYRHLNVVDKNQGAWQLTLDEVTGDAVLLPDAVASALLADTMAHFPANATNSGPHSLPAFYSPSPLGQLVPV